MPINKKISHCQNDCRLMTNFSNSISGYALIETLVALAIFAIGMLKFVQLDIQSSRAAQDNLLRAKANILASDVIDRMRGNYEVAMNGGYNIGLESAVGSSGGCDTSTCDAATLKTWDLSQWKNSISTQLPGGKGEITSQMQGDMRLYSVTIEFVNRDHESDAIILTAGL